MTHVAAAGIRVATRSRIAPGPRPHPLFGNLPAFRRDPLGFLLHAAREHGDVVRLWIGRRPAHLFRRPEHIEEILRVRQHNYPKRQQALDRMALVLGQGLVTSSGELWRRQRRTIQPAFHQQRIAALGATMEQVIADLVRQWRAPAERGAAIDVHREMMGLAFRVVGEALFGTDLSAVTQAVREALAVIERQTSDRLYRLACWPLWLPTAPNREFRSAVATLDRTVAAIVAKRRAAAKRPPDLLTGLLDACDEAGRPMHDRQLRDEILTLLLAGHENTGNVLTWMWYLLAVHPEVERRVHQELRAVLGDRTPTAADLPALPYCGMVVAETLRLYPTSWLLLREAAEDDEIGGYHIRRGSVVLISPFVTHRHPEWWPAPDTFDPDRFAAAPAAARHRYAYIPFGAGARMCIGSTFAVQEAQLVLAVVASRYRLTDPPVPPPTPRPVVSLPPDRGPVLTIKPRAGRP